MTRHSTPWVGDRDAGVRRRRLGALRPRRLDAGARPGRGAARQARGTCSACSSSRRASTTCFPLDDRRFERFNADLAGRPQLVPRQLAAAVRRHGPAVRELGRREQEQVASRSRPQIDVPEGGAEGVIIAQGGAFGGFASTPRTASRRTATTSSGCSGSRSTATSRSPPASTRCGWSSPTTAAASARAATSTLFVDGEQVGEGRVDATVPMLFSADETTDVGATARRRSATTTARRTASSRARCAGSRSTSTPPPRTPTT